MNIPNKTFYPPPPAPHLGQEIVVQAIHLLLLVNTTGYFTSSTFMYKVL